MYEDFEQGLKKFISDSGFNKEAEDTIRYVLRNANKEMFATEFNAWMDKQADESAQLHLGKEEAPQPGQGVGAAAGVEGLHLPAETTPANSGPAAGGLKNPTGNVEAPLPKEPSSFPQGWGGVGIGAGIGGGLGGMAGALGTQLFGDDDEDAKEHHDHLIRNALIGGGLGALGGGLLTGFKNGTIGGPGSHVPTGPAGANAADAGGTPNMNTPPNTPSPTAAAAPDQAKIASYKLKAAGNALSKLLGK